MSEDALLDQAAQLIADARVACLKLGIPPEDIAKIMMDEAILALIAERLSLSDIACLKLGIPPEDIAKIMMDEAILALIAERLSLSDIQATFKKYAKRDLPRFYTRLQQLASDQTAPRAE